VTSVGVIGLGRMGRPVAARLLGAGFDIVVHNRSAGPVDALVDQGARAAASPAEVDAGIVITLLPDPETVEAVTLDAARPGSLLVDMSTSPPALAIRLHSVLRDRGAAAIDAPVSGGVTGARDGTLTIMAGGDAADLERARPVLDALSSRISHVGGPGAGQIAKAVNQLVVALNIQAVAEGLSLARSAGLDPALVREALLGGFADSRVLREHGQRMLERNFVPGGALRLHQKDLRIAGDLAARYDAPAPALEQVTAAVDRLVEAGHGELDHSALMLAYAGIHGKV
jgi:2-hydroxy-3-oxopropionate reductase